MLYELYEPFWTHSTPVTLISLFISTALQRIYILFWFDYIT